MALRFAVSQSAGRIVLCLALAFGLAPSPGFGDDAPLVQALRAAEARESDASPNLLPLLGQLAQERWRAGEWTEAAVLRRRALVIAIAAFGCESPSAASAMADLALLHIDQRRYLDAEPLLIAAWRVLPGRVPADHPVPATVAAAAARVAVARGETGPAIEWAARGVEIARRNPQGRSAEPLRALGAALAAAERFAEARPLLDEALAQDMWYHGPESAETARSLAQFANLHLRWGRPRDALAPIQQAAAIDQRRLGPAHPFIADDLHDLGLVYEALGRADQARRAFAAAVALLERGAGRETPRVAYAELELSRLYRRAGDDGAADSAFRDARRILNKAEAEERRRERRA